MLNPNYALAYISRGKAYSQKGLYDQARIDYHQAVRINPKYGVIYY
jgi:Tfp pilus assembly protein PilF